MFIRYLVILVLFSISSSNTQAAAAATPVDSTSGDTSATAPKSTISSPHKKIGEQIEDWMKIFEAYRGQDLMTVPMPELKGKVDELTAYVRPAIQDAEALSIIDRYAREVRAAYDAGSLTFNLYTRYFMAMVRLLTPMEPYSDKLRSYDDLKTPLASAEWLDLRTREKVIVVMWIP